MADTGAESRILEAAHRVFLEKGMAGARMQEIADRAGINKALLHYYFRSKEKLYQHILHLVFGQFWKRILSNRDEKEFDLKDFANEFVASYTDLLIQNPYIPMFMFGEMQKNPTIMDQIMKENGGNPQTFLDLIQNDLHRRGVNHIQAPAVMVNLLSLTVFPFVARPMLQYVIFKNDEASYLQFLEERKNAIWNWVELMLKQA